MYSFLINHAHERGDIMTVLQVCAYSAEYGGNFIASLLALDAHLISQGIKSLYLFPSAAKDKPWCKDLARFRTVYFANTNRFSFKTYRKIKCAMSKADIIHSHFELYDCLTALALKKHQKLFWHLHDSFEQNIDFIHRIINKIQYAYLGKRAILLSPNPFYAEYVENIGFNNENIRIIPNCIDINRLTQKELSNTLNEKVDFLTFGGFYKIKGLDVLLNSCRILKAQGFTFRLGIVGYNSTWDYIQENYSDVTDCILQWQPSENVQAFYNAANTYVSASRRESFPYTLLETLYLKKPSIISDIEGTKWAKKWNCVKFFESENSSELAELMAESLKNPTFFSKKTIEKASNDVAEKYSIDCWVKQIEREYKNVSK